MQQLKIIIQLLPYLIDLIKLVESNLPEKGKGKEKLQFIRETLEGISPELTEHWVIIEKIITSLVTLFNNTGVFKKS